MAEFKHSGMDTDASSHASPAGTASCADTPALRSRPLETIDRRAQQTLETNGSSASAAPASSALAAAAEAERQCVAEEEVDPAELERVLSSILLQLPGARVDQVHLATAFAATYGRRFNSCFSAGFGKFLKDRPQRFRVELRPPETPMVILLQDAPAPAADKAAARPDTSAAPARHAAAASSPPVSPFDASMLRSLAAILRHGPLLGSVVGQELSKLGPQGPQFKGSTQTLAGFVHAHPAFLRYIRGKHFNFPLVEWIGLEPPAVAAAASSAFSSQHHSSASGAHTPLQQEPGEQMNDWKIRAADALASMSLSEQTRVLNALRTLITQTEGGVRLYVLKARFEEKHGSWSSFANGMQCSVMRYVQRHSPAFFHLADRNHADGPLVTIALTAAGEWPPARVLRPDENLPLSGRSTPYKMTPCYFPPGKCPKGERCTFLHAGEGKHGNERSAQVAPVPLSEFFSSRARDEAQQSVQAQLKPPVQADEFFSHEQVLASMRSVLLQHVDPIRMAELGKALADQYGIVFSQRRRDPGRAATVEGKMNDIIKAHKQLFSSTVDPANPEGTLLLSWKPTAAAAATASAAHAPAASTAATSLASDATLVRELQQLLRSHLSPDGLSMVRLATMFRKLPARNRPFSELSGRSFGEFLDDHRHIFELHGASDAGQPFVRLRTEATSSWPVRTFASVAASSSSASSPVSSPVAAPPQAQFAELSLTSAASAASQKPPDPIAASPVASPEPTAAFTAFPHARFITPAASRPAAAAPSSASAFTSSASVASTAAAAAAPSAAPAPVIVRLQVHVPGVADALTVCADSVAELRELLSEKLANLGREVPASMSFSTAAPSASSSHPPPELTDALLWRLPKNSAVHLLPAGPLLRVHLPAGSDAAIGGSLQLRARSCAELADRLSEALTARGDVSSAGVTFSLMQPTPAIRAPASLTDAQLASLVDGSSVYAVWAWCKVSLSLQRCVRADLDPSGDCRLCGEKLMHMKHMLQ